MARPLLKRKKDGSLYQRQANIESLFDKSMTLDTTELVRRIALPLSDADRLPSECIVGLLRDAHLRDDRKLFDALYTPLITRCVQLSFASGLNEEKVDHILGAFADFLADELFESKLHKLDFYECMFNKAFQTFRISELRKLHKVSASPEASIEAVEGGDKREPKVLAELSNLMSRDRPPDEIVSDREDTERRKKIVCDAIANLPDELREVVILRYYFGYAADPDDPLDPFAMASAGVLEKEYELVLLPPGDLALKGARALIDEQSGLICCEDKGTRLDRAQLIAHELGHACGHAGSCSCSADDIDPTRSTEAVAVGLHRVEDYGVRERRELQANVFAREFLLPKKLAFRLYITDGLTAQAIADRTGLPLNLVRQQLFDALLLPQARPVVSKETNPVARTADPSQARATAHRGVPFQLQAGPGTGKTRTLVDRICSLVRDGVDPASILVLTFSNRAAGELVERLSLAIPNEATRIWAGTFHAFGLDIVRRYHDRFGLSANPTLFDRSETIEAMEESFPMLPLKHHRGIWDPRVVLCDVLNAVSRAKDELVDAERYRQIGEAMLKSAETDEAKVEAEKCIEVSVVYASYERLLAERGAIDFGDLIMKPASLLETDEVARATLQLRHRHVLVDEYQDVNYASARLLKAIAGDGKRLWVVGDTRQSIYRFRGASSSNMAAFSREYPGAAVGA